MRFLVDNSMSPRFADILRSAGHDANHVRDIGLADADDATIFDYASADRRIIVAQDSDFGTILALRRTTNPSVILFRCRLKSTEATSRLFLDNLLSIQSELQVGAVVVFEDTRIRTRRLPLGGFVQN